MKKRNRAIWPLAALLFLSASNYSNAQQTQSPEYFKRLPVVRWIDNTHYSIIKQVDGKTMNVVVDTKTGEAKPGELTRNNNSGNNRFSIRRNGTVMINYNGGIDSIQHTNNPTPSPDTSLIAYTRNNDLYVYEISSRKEWRATTDGSDQVYNGRSSWVYNEEILGRGTAYRAFWWSPDSKHLAFMHFNDTNVPLYDHFDDEGVHGKHTRIHYPQPGDPNPEVKVGIININDKQTIWADFDSKTDQYFGLPYWTPSGDALWVQWLNRRQDSLKIESVNIASGRHQNIYTETQKTWIDFDLDNRITFLPARNSFLLMSDKSGWMHLYLHNMKGRELKQLTSGQWTVKSISGIDEKNGWVYFIADKENSTRTDLYKVKLDGTGMQRLTFGDYLHMVQLSPDASYFITTYGNYKTPTRMALVNNNGQLIKELADVRGKDFAQYATISRHTEMIRVKTPDGFELPVRITFPAGYDPQKKYPVRVPIYGGPNFEFVRDGYTDNFSLNEKKEDFIMVQLDHRGSGHFGKMGQNYLYKQLGKWEIEDYSTIVKFLEKTYSSFDSSRVCISGFSYGGYLTCLALVKVPDIFTFGTAGGSVTDWRLYDTHYTERYMGLPSTNPDGYKQASVMTYVKNYKGLLRLAQGTMDDNVHMQNTMQLVSALQNAGKHFELMFYPGGAHGWLGLHEKFAHYTNEDALFISKNLLTK